MPAGEWTAEAVRGLGESAVRVDLPRDGAAAARGVDLDAALDAEPDLVGLPVHGLDALGAAGLDANARLVARAAEADVDVVLLARGDAREAEAIVAFAAEHEVILAVSVERVDEEALDVLGTVERLGVLAPGFEIVSAFRRGACGADRWIGLLSPRAGTWILETCSARIGDALDLERRLQRFLETSLDRARRGFDGNEEAFGRLLVALGGWAGPAFPEGPGARLDLDALRADLLDACPELTPHLGG
ncbi:MAG: hypothetical protein AAGB93_09380 [Planctomycetota bacterium]